MRIISILIIALFLVLPEQVEAKQSETNKVTLDENAIWLTASFQQTKKKKDAMYTAVLVNQVAEGYFFKVNYLTGELKMEGYYTDAEMTMPNGIFTFYHKNGQVESMGEFADGTKFGIWQRYDSTGRALTNKIYTSQQMMDAITNSETD